MKGSLFVVALVKKLKTRIAFVLVVICLLLMILEGCSKNPVKVGFIADLSSRKSQLGISARNGLMFAIDKVNEKGGILGRKVVAVVKDNKGSKDESYRVAKELSDEGVSLIIGPFISTLADSVIEATKNKKILVVGPTVSADHLTNRDDHFFRVIMPASSQGHNIARAAKIRKDMKVVLVSDERNAEYTKAVVGGFNEMAPSLGINTLKHFSFQSNEQFKSIAEEVKKLNPSGLFLVSSGIDAAALVQQLSKVKFVPNLYGSMWTKASNVHQYGGKAVEGMIATDSYINKDPLEREVKFIKNFEEKFNVKPNFAVFYTYETLMMYSKAVSFAKDFSYEKVKETLLNFDEIEGVRDNFRFNRFGDVLRKQSFFIIRDGKYVLYHEEN
jgi:branched-chain amino acid transport system substrate-binding protein